VNEVGDRGVPRDASRPMPVVSREVVYEGHIVDLLVDRVDLGDLGGGGGAASPGGAGVVTREYLAHPGAVAIIALSSCDEVLLLDQYRHPVRCVLWEPPAGLLDKPGEPELDAARRELMEEADLEARRWDVLVDYFTSPGILGEGIRVFLARDLVAVPEGRRFAREDEEKTMRPRWVPLDVAVDAVLAGTVHSPSAIVGILAAAAARRSGWARLRPADSPWSVSVVRRAMVDGQDA
jgi:ADP-ribose pyrophosphatase